MMFFTSFLNELEQVNSADPRKFCAEQGIQYIQWTPYHNFNPTDKTVGSIHRI